MCKGWPIYKKQILLQRSYATYTEIEHTDWLNKSCVHASSNQSV